MKTQKLYFFLAIFLLLLSLTAKAEPQKKVIIKGKIENYSKHKDKGSSIICSVYELAYRDHTEYIAKITNEGTFEISVPFYQSGTIGLEFLKRFSAYAKPGDVIQLFMNADDPDNSIIFKGDEAKFNNLNHKYSLSLQNAWKELHKDYEPRYEKVQNSPEQYKQLSLEMLSRRLNFLVEFGKKNKASKAFMDRAKENTEYSFANDLSFHGLNYGFPKSYFDDVFNRFPVANLPESISGVHAMYLHNYCMYLRRNVDSKKYTSPMNFQKVAVAFLSNSHKFTESEKDLLTRFATNESGNKLLGKNDTTQYLNIFNSNLDLYFEHFSPSVPWIEYFLKETDGHKRDLFFSWSLHEFIESNHLDVAKGYLSTYEAVVENERLKAKILEFYNNRLKELKDSKLTTDSKIRAVPKDAGDSLLYKVTAPYAGKVVYLDFWGTWCGPCIAEMPNAAKLKEELEGKEVVFLYLGVNSPEKAWKQMIAKLNIKGEHYLLNQQEYKLLEKKLGINGIPHYVLLDRRGNITDAKAMRPGDPILKNKIAALVEDK